MSEGIKSCWVLTEGIAGTENQCLGLAEVLGVDFMIKRLKLRTPWRQLSPWLSIGHDHALASESDPLLPPYPDLLIASGRKAIGMGLHIKKKSGGKTFLVNIQDPRIGLKDFDLVIVPQHDPSRGDNVLVTRTALHRVTPQKIEEGRKYFHDRFAHLPSPRVAVLIGGSSKSHTMTVENTKALTHQLMQLADLGNIGMMITASRRTGEENIAHLRQNLSGPNIAFWDGSSTGENPYFGFLALADYIIVTEDSVSMTSEALATGKPVYIVSLEGGARRLDLFHKMLQDQGYTRPFTGLLEQWSYAPPDDTIKAAAEIRKRMKEK